MGRRGIALGLLILTLVVGAGAGGYLLGSRSAADEADALAQRRASMRAALDVARSETLGGGLSRGLAAGLDAGARSGRGTGGPLGEAAGAAAVKRARAAEPRKEPDDPRPVPPGDVLVVGDSLEVLTSPYLKRYLPSARLTINAEGGYSSIQLFELFSESFDPSHSVIVFDAGTNDNPAYPEILDSRLRAVARAVGDRCMVVPTIHAPPVNGVTPAGKNRVVGTFAALRPGTQVPDWASAVARHPELMQSDNLHPTAEGADFRARLIARGVRACLLF